MWVVIKYERKKIGILINELKKRFNNLKIYDPKFRTKLKFKNRIVENELSLLGDYLFCYHENFENPNFIKILRFTRGIKLLIEGYKCSQKDIKDFIYRCKKSENSSGYLTNSFYNLYENSNFKFNSGIFSNFIFKIIRLQKNKMDILLGNLKITTEKEKFILNRI